MAENWSKYRCGAQVIKKSLSQKTQKEDEDTKMQKPTCFCKQRSYKAQISKIFIGTFLVTFKRIFMSVIKKNIQKVIKAAKRSF